jgi:hypothetical protein
LPGQDPGPADRGRRGPPDLGALATAPACLVAAGGGIGGQLPAPSLRLLHAGGGDMSVYGGLSRTGDVYICRALCVGFTIYFSVLFLASVMYLSVPGTVVFTSWHFHDSSLLRAVHHQDLFISEAV